MSKADMLISMQMQVLGAPGFDSERGTTKLYI